jgi:hypothetical protein
MDGEDTAWLAVLEKKGLHQAAGILENYGIDCETVVSLLDRDDFSKLASNGLKPCSIPRQMERNLQEGWEVGTCMKLPFCCMREAYSGMHLEID